MSHHSDRATSSGERPADVSAEQGRGIDLMRALVDQVRFVSKPEEGTVVHLEKLITYGDGALAGADGIGR